MNYKTIQNETQRFFQESGSWSSSNGGGPYKIKVGESIASDVERVRLSREIIGPDALLMVDVNGSYNAELALQSMSALADYGIHWMEEPVPPEDFAGLERLGRRRSVPIATAEAHCTIYEMKRLLDTGAVDVLMPDLTLCGGLDEGMATVQLARLYGVRVSPHVWGSGIGLAAAAHYVAAIPAEPRTLQAPHPALVEYDCSENPLRDELLTEPLLPSEGRLPLPQGPGLGVEPDRRALERFAAG